MYKIFTRLLLLGLIGVYTNLSAQEYNLPVLSGQVLDAQSGEPLVGAVISVDFKKSGATTDAKGTYKISLPVGEYIVKVSNVGYNPFRTKIYIKKDTSLLVELNDVTKQLEEVIVSASSSKKDIQTPSLGVTVLSLKGIKKLPTMMGEVGQQRRAERI